MRITLPLLAVLVISGSLEQTSLAQDPVKSSVRKRMIRTRSSTGSPTIGAEDLTKRGSAVGDQFSVSGAIAEKYNQLGGKDGPLGAVTSEERSAPLGGRFQEFERGRIYWHGETGAFAVYGEIAKKWNSIGWLTFGYPITDQLVTPDGRGLFNHFRAVDRADKAEASIYWTERTGAHAIYGAIREKWASLGWERSVVGYPTSDEFEDNGYRRVDFEHGYYIRWSAKPRPADGDSKGGAEIACRQWKMQTRFAIRGGGPDHDGPDVEIDVIRQTGPSFFAKARYVTKIPHDMLDKVGDVIGKIEANRIYMQIDWHTNPQPHHWFYNGALQQAGSPKTLIEGNAYDRDTGANGPWWMKVKLECEPGPPSPLTKPGNVNAGAPLTR